MHRICLWQDIAEHDPDARFVDNLRSAANGATRWRYQSSKPMIGGVVVTGGAPARPPETSLYSMPTTALHNVGGPIAGGMVSYASGGNQYVAVVSGFVGGHYNRMTPEIGGANPTITVFALKP